MAYFANKINERQDGVEDLCLMSTEITDANIVKQLGIRLVRGQIHCSISNVLIIMNPFKTLPIYGPSHIQMYQKGAMSDASPHIFALSERAYRKMVLAHVPQAVIISGESGAGKTETAKMILHYSSSVSGSSTSQSQRMKQIILESNPLLEAFGNAKTTRNNNSSRFGKYLELSFTSSGEPVGGVTTNFLLEKVRVSFQQKQERNYHVFYQMLEGAWPELLQACKMGPANQFYYLSQSGVFDIPGVDDGRNFREVAHACTTIGISPTEQWYLFSTLCGILHLGNVKFIGGSEAPCKVHANSQQSLQTAGILFGVDPSLLLVALNHKTVAMGGKRGSVVKIPQNSDQATQIKDALAREMYSRCFDYIVTKVNLAMRASNQHPGNTLGILDIFGFEIFDHNLFEQLCINFVNEKLQQIFLDAVVKGEQQLYVSEGLKWTPIPFFDNLAICELIEGTKAVPGVFRILDDTCRALHAVDSRTADEKFLERLAGSGLQGKYLQLRPGNSNFAGSFTVTHFAGQVSYDVDEMAFKNMDNLFGSLVDCMKTSQAPFVKLLWPANEDRINQQPTTSSTKIRQSAGDLVTTLRRCETHYVRCVKSNDQRLPMTMDAPRVEEQIKYQGLRENVKVKKAGFSSRFPYQDFVQQFSILASRHEQTNLAPGKAGVQQLTTFLSKKFPDIVPSGEWAFGNTLLFVRSPQTIFALQELMEEARDPKGSPRVRLRVALERRREEDAW
ncbi:hypothetical protein BASA81_012699 [Batrachochytrium salamandrivorans]|nr:hypothetical protein BASA81_012699 [Batrachochytrium salamandrivorans]